MQEKIGNKLQHIYCIQERSTKEIGSNYEVINYFLNN